MKKAHSILTAATLSMVLALSSCNGSVKGKWSPSDKAEYDSEISKIDLSALGTKKDRWIECYYQKVEAAYPSFADANQDEEGCKKLAFSCNDEVISNGSVKGKWSEMDKQELYGAMKESGSLNALLDSEKKAWFTCYVNKLEATFPSLFYANQDGETCEKLAIECNKEFIE